MDVFGLAAFRLRSSGWRRQPPPIHEPFALIKSASAVASSAPSGPAPGLSTIVITQSLRYWLLAAWAFLLGLCRDPWVAAAWFAACCAIGIGRGHVERVLARRASLTIGAELTLIAFMSSIAWAIAPILAWTAHGPWSLVATVAFLSSGGLLVATQFRHLPRRALVVGTPYIATLLFVLADASGGPTFWPLLAVTGVVSSALATKVLFGGVHKAQIDAFQAEQARLIRELEHARDVADAASQAKSAFLATISHELRTPMNGVLGAAQLLERAPLDENALDLVAVIRRSGDTLARLLDDVLDFASIEQGRLEIAPSAVDLPALMRGIVTLWSARAMEKGLSLSLDLAEAVPTWVKVDPVRLSQILHNLISNAVKFTEAGAISLRVTVEPQDGERSDRLQICVQDNGPGVADRDQDRLFKAFSQIDGSSTRRHGGAGLGLAISRRIAGLLGGDLWLAASEQGACFMLDLPLSQTVAPAAIAPQKPGAERMESLSVLLVEDHPVNRKLVATWLMAAGHSCATAEDGRQALETYRDGAFDLILMDVNMPVMDGLSAVRALRASGARTPVVMLSASASAADEAAGMDAGADGYLSKPLDFAVLQDVLTQVGRLRDAEKSEHVIREDAL